MKILNAYFWIKKADASKKTGLAPIKLRVSFAKSDEDNINTGFSVNPDNWSNDFKRVHGTANANQINQALDRIYQKIVKIDLQLDTEDKEKNAQIIKNIYEGKGEHRKWTLLELIDDHNKKFEQGIEKNKKGHTEETLKKYINLKLSLQIFLKGTYNRSDIYASELSYAFVEEYVYYLSTEHSKKFTFQYFLKTKYQKLQMEPQDVNPQLLDEYIRYLALQDTDKGLGHETIRSSYYGKLNKIISNAEKRNLTPRNPFGDFKMERLDDVMDKTHWLNMEEIVFIAKYKFTKSTRLERIRHRTVIALFTGIAYSDLESLHVDNIHVDINNFRYIDLNRKKSNGQALIPVIPEFEEILDYYIESAPARDGKLLPKLSNKCFGDYLTEILTIMGINKETTPHKLRHSFAQSSIDAGASVEAVAKMLGHKSTRTVLKHYATITKNVVFDNRNKLQDKINIIKGDIPSEDDTIIKQINSAG